MLIIWLYQGIEICVAARISRSYCGDWIAREQPARVVAMDAFWIDRTEVTNEQYQKCVDAGACLASNYEDVNESDYNGAAQPVVGIDWHNAKAYCEWVGAKLPTEAQWEYAARGINDHMYPWGDTALTCELANYLGCGHKTLPVGSFPDGASWVGALDMAGNVWEWVADWYGSYMGVAQTNPVGPTSGTFKVLSLIHISEPTRPY